MIGSGSFEESGANDYFYTRDHLGSVREVVGSDGTTLASRLSYDPWGKVTESGSVPSDFGFTGHHFDRPTGLDLTQYRAFDPQLGRWLSKDPLGLRGGLNLYGYVGNDPINYVDPDGRLGHGVVCAYVYVAVRTLCLAHSPHQIEVCELLAQTAESICNRTPDDDWDRPKKPPPGPNVCR